MKPAATITLALLSFFTISTVRAAEPEGNAEVAKLLAKFVGDKLPKPFAVEDASDWGKTVPDPGNLRPTRLVRRQWVQVGDHMELPNGIWKRTHLVIDDPKRDIDIRIPNFRRVNDKKLDLQVEATVKLIGEREWKVWRYGVGLPGVNLEADVVVVITLDCDVGINVLKGKFPPEIEVSPTVRQVRLDVKDFSVRRIGPVSLLGETSKSVSDDLRGFIEGMVKAKEAEAKDFANKAIAQALQDGKAKLSVADLLKLQGDK